MNKKTIKINKLVMSAMFMALGLVLPFLTMQFESAGTTFCPMHLPVLLCGFICGWLWGWAVGFITPIIRSVVFGMPLMFPQAISMAFELGTYGFVTGLLYKIFKNNNEKKNSIAIYISLIVAMISGRLVWAMVKFTIIGFNVELFNFKIFWTSVVMTEIPGIITQLILVPVIVMIYEKSHIYQ